MKTTIDIPEPIYRHVKIHAATSGKTLKDVVLEALAHEFAKPTVVAEKRGSYWANRKLMPAYEAAIKAGAFIGGTDSTRIIEEERKNR